MMQPETIKSVSKKIYRRFPEMADVKPKVSKRKAPQTNSKPATSSPAPTYLLTFQTKVKGPRGENIPRWVRVVTNETGKIIKITTSR
jgi:hypothetical protein